MGASSISYGGWDGIVKNSPEGWRSELVRRQLHGLTSISIIEILSQMREKILEMTGGLYDSDCAVDHGKIMVCLVWFTF